MTNCCETPEPINEASCCCGSDAGKVVLLYACSGGANVGEISDKAARELMFEGKGTMFCLAGLGGDLVKMPFGVDLPAGAEYGAGTVVLRDGVRMLQVPL